MSVAHGLNIGDIFVYGDMSAYGEALGISGLISPMDEGVPFIVGVTVNCGVAPIGVPENGVVLLGTQSGASIGISSNVGFGRT